MKTLEIKLTGPQIVDIVVALRSMAELYEFDSNNNLPPLNITEKRANNLREWANQLKDAFNNNEGGQLPTTLTPTGWPDPKNNDTESRRFFEGEGFILEQTGGGCTAFMMWNGNDDIIMVTVDNDASHPTDDDTFVTVGIYDKQSEPKYVGHGNRCFEPGLTWREASDYGAWLLRQS